MNIVFINKSKLGALIILTLYLSKSKNVNKKYVRYMHDFDRYVELVLYVFGACYAHAITHIA